MTPDNKGVRYNPRTVKDLSPDQKARLLISIELLMGVLSDFGWEERQLYKRLVMWKRALEVKA